MIQQLLIAILFLTAVVYLGRIGWRSWRAKNACEAGCGKCKVADVGLDINLKKQGQIN